MWLTHTGLTFHINRNGLGFSVVVSITPPPVYLISYFISCLISYTYLEIVPTSPSPQLEISRVTLGLQHVRTVIATNLRYLPVRFSKQTDPIALVTVVEHATFSDLSLATRTTNQRMLPIRDTPARPTGKLA